MQRHNRSSPRKITDARRLLGFKNPECAADKFGRKCCAFCAEPVAKGRRTYCSEDCAAMGRHAGAIGPREVLWLRDRGVCQLCGLNTDEEAAYHALCGDVPKFYRRHQHVELGEGPHWLYRYGHAVEYILESHGADTNRTDTWDMDHVIGVEIYTGDPEYLNDLGNLRTLCIPCHRKVTAQQAADRAKRKRKEKRIGPKEARLRELRRQN